MRPTRSNDRSGSLANRKPSPATGTVKTGGYKPRLPSNYKPPHLRNNYTGANRDGSGSRVGSNNRIPSGNRNASGGRNLSGPRVNNLARNTSNTRVSPNRFGLPSKGSGISNLNGPTYL